ncbi:DEKNAAC103019 [Brettanomyces naardenensis]|uniref:DEKNAAC103019 n=1 Tax=Brettanomyces naardenensis TaxID=13370 RepID=A0A448YM49_BRENA|nr:DEKNAAC103019 [Brettanomyces naardenensis]
MPSVKSLLKSAKHSLAANDPEEAIDFCDEVISQDKGNYYAHLFKGKAFGILEKKNDAVNSYLKATNIDPDDPLAWKGLLQVCSNSSDYKYFFSNVLGLAKAMSKHDDNLRPCVEAMKRYMSGQRNQLNSDNLNEYYYRQVIPGLSELGDLLGEMAANPTAMLEHLINLLSKRETAACAKEIRELKMRMPGNLNASNLRVLNDAKYQYFHKSEIPKLYEMLINIETDDNRRAVDEEKLLKYKFEMLLVCPEKKELYDEIYEMVSGMVLVHTHSQFAYDTYFDFVDPVTLGSLDIRVVTDYIKTFGMGGLGAILYAYIMSEISPYDAKVVHEYMKSEKKGRRKKKKAPESDDSKKDQPESSSTEADTDDNKEKDEKNDQISNSEALTLMLNGIHGAKKSILGHRILINFCIHLNEYQYALDYSHVFIKLVLNHSKLTGTQLPNARLDSVLNLAIIYTYHESPKNFSKAMELYSSVLSMDPDNIKAKMGNGLILMENGNFKKAADMLKDVVDEYPDDYKAAQEYGWCLVKLGQYESGRKLILQALKMISGTDANSLESKSITLWRVGQSFLLELEEGSTNDTSGLLKSAYENFVSSLKQSTSYPPCYTSLGLMFLKYYGKESRALKCFYKAYDLDPSELVASYELVKHFSKQRDWEMVDVICGRVVESERARKLLLAKGVQDPSWPYRMLGCAAMERQDDAKAIEYYQSGLRISPADVQSWIGLGEAYLGRGRLEASQKVFSHVLDLEPTNWQATYLLSESQASMGEYDESIGNLQKLLNGPQKDEKCVLTSLFETLIMKAFYEVDSGFIGRSFDTIVEALDTLKKAASLDIKSQKLWKGLGEVLELCVTVQSHASKIPFHVIEETLGLVDRSKFEIPDLITEISQSSPNFDVKKLKEAHRYVELCHYFAVEAAKTSLIVLPLKSSKSLRAGSIYNLGIAYSSWFEESGSDECIRDLAITVLRKAIQLEGNNPEFWGSLGIASLTRSARVSQHCFIKASSLGPKETVIWVNLGVLYMYYGDYELANKCFVRAQSLGPSGPNPWAGEALVADALGDKPTADRLYTHSYVLANGTKPLNSLLYGLSVVKRQLGSSSKESDLDAVQEFNAAHFGLLNYLKFYPNDQLALQLVASLIERIHTFEEGVKISEQLCDILESKYEESEDTQTLISFAEAKCQLARLQLGSKQYSSAIESAGLASSLLADNEDLITEETQKCLLSSLAVTGLALYFQAEYDDSLEQFNKILEVFPDSKRVVVLVSQVLYAFDEAETKQAAVEELFKNIETYGSSLLVALTIASISIVDRLEDYLPAIKDELLTIPLESRIKDASAEIPFFIDRINKITGGCENENVWQRNAFLFPDEVQVWNNLNTTVALNVSVNSKKVDSGTLGQAYVRTGVLREIQRGIFLNPSNSEGILALKECL